MTGAWTNTILAVAAVLIIVVSNAATWAVTRLRNRCDHYTPRHARYSEGYRDGWEQHKFDAEMDAVYPDEERLAYQEAMADRDDQADDTAVDVTSPDIRWQVTP